MEDPAEFKCGDMELYHSVTINNHPCASSMIIVYYINLFLVFEWYI
jgi:hypothetical protein